MKSVWKFSITGVPQRITAPGLQRPQFVAGQSGVICVWAEVDESRPARSCDVIVHGTGRPINDDERYIGTLGEGPFVWHYYATKPTP